MDQIDQIAIQNTLSVQLTCLVNQDIIGKNFKIIMDCLKDLKTEQDSHSNLLKNLTDLKQKLQNSLKNQKDIKQNKATHEASHKQANDKHETDKSKQQSQNKIITNTSVKNESNANKNQHNQQLEDLRKQIEQLKRRVGADQENITGNTKDINLLNKEMKDVQKQIEELKRLLKNVNIAGKSNQSANNFHTKQVNNKQSNDGKDGKNTNNKDNANIDFQSIKNLNNESFKTQNLLKDLSVDFNKLNKKMEELEKELSNIKNRLNNNQGNSNQSNEQNKNNKTSASEYNYSGNDKNLTQILKKIQNLTKKTDMIQDKANLNASKISDLTEGQKTLSDQSQEHRQIINGVHKQIQQINQALEQIQNIHNEDVNNIMEEINQLKLQLEGLLKKSGQGRQGHEHQNENSNKKYSFERSGFRKKSQSSQKDDNSGKISELSTRLAYLQKLMSSKTTFEDQNPQKLPSIKKGKRDFNSTGYNDKSSVKKDLSQFKHQLEAYIKSFMLTIKGNDANGQLQLKLQQIKNTLNRKADYQGMKKGLSFLQNKITQLYLFLTEPDTQDAMIVRKGFNCLSCSKKVQKLRGKLGPRMNWDNMSSTNYSPPKVGYQKNQQKE